MRKKAHRHLLGFLIIITVLMSMSVVCLAEGALTLRTAKATVETGEKFRVVVEINAAASGLLSFGPLEVSYDPALFTYTETTLLPSNSGGFTVNKDVIGKVRMTWSPPDGNTALPLSGATYLVGVYFTAKSVGSGTFRITEAEGFSDQDLVGIAMAPGATQSVTITAPVPKSDNNNLKSLNVDPGTLTPAFAAGTLKYTMQVAEGLSKVTVSAAPADSKASVTITGNTKLVDGDNTIKITVTAENGSKKTYTIIATRAGPTPTPVATPTPAVTITLPGGLYTVLDLPLDMVPPTGFAATTITLNGQTVQIYQSAQGELNLFYLAAADGTPGLYYYNKVADTYLPFVVMTIPAQLYTVLTPDSGVTIPTGFIETTLLLNGQPVIAWQRAAATPTPGSTTTAGTTLGSTTTQALPSETTAPLSSVETTSTTAGSPDGEYLLYLMDSGGAKNFYLYNTATLALSQYIPEATIETSETTASSETTETTATGNNPIGEDFNIWQLFSLALGLICLVLIGMVIWLVVRGPGGERKEKLPPTQKPPIRRVD